MSQVLPKISAFFYPKAGWFGLVMIFGLPWSHAFFNIGLVGILVCLLASPTHYKELAAIFQEKIALLAILLFLYIAAGLLYTHAPMELAIHDVKKYRKLLLIPVFLLLYRDTQWAERLVIAYGCGAFILMMPTLLDGAGLLQTLSLDWSRLRNESYTNLSLVYWRNHIVTGFHASMLFVICVLSAIRHPKLAWPLVAVAAICLLNIVFFLHGRTALITLLAICLLMAMGYISRPFLRIALILAIFAGSLLAYQTSEKIHARVNSIAQEARSYSADAKDFSSGGTRLYYWGMSLNMFVDAPLVGQGPGAFRENLLRPDNPMRHETHKHNHNEYLMLAAQHGLFGLTLFLLLAYQIYHQAGRRQDIWRSGIVRLGLIIFLINAVTDSSLNNESEGWTFVFLACLANMRPAVPKMP